MRRILIGGQNMQRRDFMTLLGSAVAAWPRVARAQPTLPVVGFIRDGSADTARGATSGEVKDLRRETSALKEVVADLTLENRLLKKSMNGDGEDEA